MIENIIIGIVFMGALIYLGGVIMKQFSAKSSGCASCAGACKTNISLEKVKK